LKNGAARSAPRQATSFWEHFPKLDRFFAGLFAETIESKEQEGIGERLDGAAPGALENQ
jgi:hypothetical protein